MTIQVQEEVFFPIRELSTYQGAKWTIKGRVTMRAPMRGFKKRDGNGDGKVFHVELLDAEGGEIRASFFNEAAEKFFDLMEVGKCFKLSRGSVRIANRQYNTCKHRYELVFDKMAQVDEVEDDQKIETVKYAIENLRSVKGKTLPCSVDICGVITAFEQPIAFESKGRNFVKRNLTIADDSAMSMIVTIWAERAQKEDTVFKGNPMVVMKGVMVKEWQGGRSGSLTEGGLMVMQPDIPEAKAVSAWWQSTGHAQEITFISQTNGLPGPRASGKTMDIMQMKQASEQMVTEQETFSIYCRLAAVQTRKRDEVQPLVYNACMELKDGMNGRTLPCNRRVDENGFCAVCDKKGKAGPRLNLRCRFEDASGNCWLTTFHPAAEKILALSAQEVQDIEQNQGREGIENKLKETYYGEMLQIIVRAKPESYNGESRTGVSCIAASPAPVREHSRMMLKEIEDMLAK